MIAMPRDAWQQVRSGEPVKLASVCVLGDKITADLPPERLSLRAGLHRGS